MSCLACIACQTGSCLINCCGRTTAFHSSTLTRAAYFALFLATAGIAWVFEIWGAEIFGSSDLFSYLCDKATSCRNMLGPFAAYKVTFAFVVFHLLFALVMIGVKDAHSGRGSLHNGWWGPKFLLWAGLIIGFLFLPPSFLTVYAWISIVGSVVFTIIQLFMLVDFAHTWNDSWVAKYHETQNKNWFRLLLLMTILLMLLSLVGTVLMYVFLLGDASTCPYHVMNIAVVSVNFGLLLLATVMSVLPRVQASNPRASLLTASIVCTYATYLVWSALFSEPDCQSSTASVQHPAFKYASLIIGAVITFIAVAFSSVRAGSHQDTATEQSKLIQKGSLNAARSADDEEPPHVEAEDDDDIEVAKRKAQEKADRELLKLDEPPHGGDHVEDPVRYSYTWFHIVMLLGSMYVACLMTNWAVVSFPGANATTTSAIATPAAAAFAPLTMAPGSALQVDRSLVSTWLKIASSWVVIALYIWTLVAPMVLPDRDFGFER